MICPSTGNSFDGFSSEELKKLLGGTIINYAGLYAGLLYMHGGFHFRCNLATFLFLGAVACV